MLTKLAFYVLLGVIAIGLHIGFGQPLETIWIQFATERPWPADVLTGLGIGLSIVIISRFASTRWRWTQRIDAEFRLVLGPLSGLEIFLLALLSSTVEELFFRGFLQGQIGVGLAALAFGLAHFPYRKNLIPWTVAAILVGWGFGLLVQASGNIVAAIVAHFVINYLNLHYITRPKDAFKKESPSDFVGQFDSINS